MNDSPRIDSCSVPKGWVAALLMRRSLFALVFLASLPGSQGQAANFCLTGHEGREDCSYNTFEQCRASMSGGGSFCVRNPHDPAAWARARGQ